MTDHTGAPGPQLPDFSGGGRGGASPLPELSSGGGAGGSGGGGGKGPLIALLLGVAGFLVIVVAIVALVLSQTVFSTDPEDPTAGGGTGPETEETERTRPSEFVPTEEQTDEADGETTFAAQPTVDCTVHDNEVVTEQVDGVVRGGGLEFRVQEGWEVGSDWGSQGAYLTDQSFAHQPVENGWFTVAGVGAVQFPEEEGGYPGAEETARAIFRCGLSRDQVEQIYDDPPELVDYRDEATTIDGHPAWIVSAEVQISQTALFHTTDAWHLVVIVVDTPDGPAAFDGGAALGHDQQVEDLEVMLEGLRVL